VLSYVDVLSGRVTVGERVALIGAGGIGFDVAEFLLKPRRSSDEDLDQDQKTESVFGEAPVADIEEYLNEWGVDLHYQEGSGLIQPHVTSPPRTLYLLQRSPGKLGAKLGKTTGWIHRAQLKKAGVELLSGVSYDQVDEIGLHITHEGESRLLEVDHVVVCAGQLVNRDLYQVLIDLGVTPHLIGGASKAGELDAKRAIREGFICASQL
jgi:2,4-dienoyl-CoA reductase (NADPH2)